MVSLLFGAVVAVLLHAAMHGEERMMYVAGILALAWMGCHS